MTYANKIISDSSEINNLLTAHDNFVKSKNHNLALACLDDIKKINKKIPKYRFKLFKSLLQYWS